MNDNRFPVPVLSHKRKSKQNQGKDEDESENTDSFFKKAIEPKVWVPFKQPPGCVPRKIVIERKRRAFQQQNITDLLLAEGIDYNDPKTHKSLLPLEVFDNADFDPRTCDEWMSLAVEGDVKSYIPAKTLKVEEDKYTWKDCKVWDCKKDENKYLVEIDGQAEKTYVPRIDLLFSAEDPKAFAQRVVWAHKTRKETESLLRYNLYVDYMPTDEIAPLQDDHIDRIRNWSVDLPMKLREIKRKEEDTANYFILPLVDNLVEEAKKTYSRTINKIIFDVNMEKNPNHDLFSNLTLPQSDNGEIVPECGVISIPENNYLQNSKTFGFDTYLNDIHALRTLDLIRGELLEKETLNIFSVPLKKTAVTLDEFDQIQTQSLKKTVEVLKGETLTKIRDFIKENLKNVGKGWLNINEPNREIYEMSKLKKFMNAVRFMMEESVRNTMANSLSDFLEFLHFHTCYDISMDGVGSVTLNFKKNKKRPKPLFGIEIVKEATFSYNIDLNSYENKLLQLFDKVIADFQTIPHVEHLVMEKYFWVNNVQLLKVLNAYDKEIVEFRADLQKVIQSSIEPLRKYIKYFDEFLKLTEINIPDFMQEFQNKQPSHEDIKNEILQFRKLQNDIFKRVPNKIQIGCFLVEISKVRNQMTKHCRDIIDSLLKLLAKISKEKAAFIREEYTKLSKRIQEPVQNINKLHELKEFLKNEVGAKAEELEKKIEECKKHYELLDSFRSLISLEEFKHMVQANRWPKTLAEHIEQFNSSADKIEENFYQKMKEEQKDFSKKIEELGRDASAFAQRTGMTNDVIAKNAADVKKIQQKIKKYQDDVAKFNNQELLFKAQVSEYGELKRIVRDFQPFANFWTTTHEWRTEVAQCFHDPFENLDAILIDDNVKKAEKTMAKSITTFKDLPQISKMAQKIKDEIKEFKPNLPLMLALRTKGMEKRHWEKVSKEIGITLQPGTSFSTLQDLIDMKIGDQLEKIEKVAEVASKENTIKENLEMMRNQWKTVNFDVMPYRNAKDVFIIKINEETQQILDDNLALTQTLSFSQNKDYYAAELSDWEGKLNNVFEVTEEWLNCQREWMAIEPIFSGEEMKKQLPELHKQFTIVDSKWKKIMQRVYKTPNIMEFCSSQKNLLKTFKENNKILSVIQKGLNEYLEKKRKQFARLYFLADDELLAILSQAKEPTAVQPYLKKCFENIKKLKFIKNETNGRLQMTAMYSKEDELIQFAEPLEPIGSVELWLKEVEQMMKKSIKTVLAQSLADYEVTPKNDWVMKWPGQVLIVGSQIFWTKHVSEALENQGEAGVKKLAGKLRQQIVDMTDVVRRDITPLDREKLSALITIDVHARDVVDQMVKDKVGSIGDFQWVSQLRFYWENGECKVKQVEGNFDYGYEYLGNTSRLVITPLTDRIYLTLTGALHLNLGGAPAGPAGTGKTETVKDLAKALAKQCVVFNCQEGLDEFAMGKFFKGLVMSGAWACFDEFNRIDVEVLSVVAQQISVLQGAVKAKAETVSFEGTTVTVDVTFAVFITMNPGYAGRTELPDNLKALFRPVACMVPDYALIAEIRMISFGFKKAQALAQKMVATFKLSSEQLSSQDHYDFGMRAVNTVIAAAGLLKRQDPSMNEEHLLLRALQDSNIPKFLANDAILFRGIISDLFPTIKPPPVDRGAIISELRKACDEQNLEFTDNFCSKCIQLFETTILRHGLMLVGATGGGKTTVYRILQKALTALAKVDKTEAYLPVKTTIINPKSVSMDQLYGKYDRNTREYQDGVLANEFREFSERDTSSTKKWLIFDGPVDALWIESMNTVLDDNKKLCLVSGAIIELSKQMTVMFEVEDLAVASPATVSRCGMVYVDSNTCVPLTSTLYTWLKQLSPVLKVHEKRFKTLLDTFVIPTIKFLRSAPTIKEYVKSTDINLITSFLKLMNCLFCEYIPIPGIRSSELTEEQKELLPQLIDPYTIFSVIWSFGATVDQNSREVFDKYMKATMQAAQITLDIPPEGMLYDYQFDKVQKKWIHWNETQAKVEIDPTANFKDITVPTTDTIRYSYLIETLVVNKQHVLAIGPTGTGKSLTVREKLMKGLPPNFLPLFVYFSARTTANQTQDIIDSKIERQGPHVYGPPQGKEFAIFVDDMNMPQKDQYGSQPPIELLRQWMDHQGWYEYRTDRLPFRKIKKISFIGAMGPPGGGRNSVTNRFLRHFNFIAFPEMTDQNMFTIFHTILSMFINKHFNETFQFLSETVVNSSIELYNKVKLEMLPTPSKSHYTFNLRDIAKVFQGVIDVNPKKVDSVNQFIRLWAHENNRVFRDRLIDDEDRGKFDGLRNQTLENHFKMQWSDISIGERLIFSDIMAPTSVSDKKSYEEVTDMESLKRMVNEKLDDFNNTQDKIMQLVMFLDAIEHVTRVGRILRQPGGNALLLGVGGSGRQSLTRLAAFMCDFQVKQPEMNKTFGEKEWKEFLKGMLLHCGTADEMNNPESVFLFCDTQIIKESFLEDINNLLNSGDIPNLYEPADVDEIYEKMKPICARKEQTLDPTTLFATYVSRVQTNLHIVLAMSPLGEAFRNRIRMFPSLINCCTIDWFSRWPNDALFEVATAQLVAMQMKDEEKKRVYSMCVYFHDSVIKISGKYLEEANRHNHVTPTSYLELLTTFETLLGERREKIEVERSRFEKGLNILKETEKVVQVLKSNIEQKQPLLEEETRKIEENLVKINAESLEVNKTAEIVKIEEAEAALHQRECEKIKNQAEEELRDGEIKLKKALDNVKNLNIKDINELGSYQNPPANVLFVMESVCIMKNVPPTSKIENGKKVESYWENSKKVLGDAKKLKTDLVSYPKEEITEKLIKKIKPYYESPKFTEDEVKKTSLALVAMCQWVRAMYDYFHISQKVEPLRISLKQAEEKLADVEARLAEKQKLMKALQEKIKQLSDENQAAELRQKKLKGEVEDCKLKLGRAEKLIDGLAGEKARWEDTLSLLNSQISNLVGDTLLCSGTVAYHGAFTADFRKRLSDEWRLKMEELEIPHRKETSLLDLVEPLTIRQWTTSGLPADSLSVENAIILHKSRRFPLMIDPQLQANKWLKIMYGQNLDVVTFNTPNYARTLQNCCSIGKPVLLEGVGVELEAAIEPYLLKRIVRKNGVDCIRVGEDDVPFSHDFKFFITTKERNPDYSPETSVKVTLLNFFITLTGLSDQLLGQVVQIEKPDLQQEKVQLMEKNVQFKKDLKQLQDNILKMLSENKGDILENLALIETLQQSKISAISIQEQVEKAEETEKKIDETRNKYLPVAQRGSLLFFCVSDMANCDPMYQYSLQWFINLFVQATEKAEESENIAQRVDNLISYFTYSLYNNVCQSLFEQHKLLFSFVLCSRIEQELGHIKSDEWRFFLTGTNVAQSKKYEKPVVGWLTEDIWQKVTAIACIRVFEEFPSVFSDFIEDFTKLFENENPEKLVVPYYGKRISAFQKLMVLRCIRPDKVTAAITDFVTEHMGEKFVKPPRFDLSRSFKDSTNIHPLVFILSPGADPRSELAKFKDEMNIRQMEEVSLGRGTEIRAKAAISNAKKDGYWVLLENCHLAISFMPDLEKKVEDLESDPTEVQKDFRLWLTSMPTKQFPVSILQNSVKMTLEPPKGLKSNLMGSYDSFSDEALQHPTKPVEFKKLLFGLCFFHAVIQERRKYGPLGWNIAYEFTKGDLMVCVQQLRLFLEKYNDVPYEVIRFLSGQINYGGRVTDDNDRRTLMNIIRTYITPEIMEDGYKFSEREEYFSIPAVNFKSYMQYFENIPTFSHPELFGLHPNAEITYNNAEFVSLCETIIAMQPRGSSAGGKERDSAIKRLAKTMLKSVPKQFDFKIIYEKYPTKYEESMNTVLIQEATKYNKLLREIDSTLTVLIKAIKGVVVMSKETEIVADKLYNNQVPSVWEHYPSLMPLSDWTEDLIRRCKFIQDWIDNGIPPVFWVSGFFFPQGFMTGILQNYARRHVVAIDSVSFSFHVVDKNPAELREKPAEGAYIHGLYLEGARWSPEDKGLVESKPRELFTKMPVIWLEPKENRAKPTSGIYDCPTYKTLRRAGTLSTTGHSTNYVISMEIPAKKEQTHYIKRGVALVCALRSATL